LNPSTALPLAIAGVFAAPFFMFKSKVVDGGLPAVTSMWYFFSVRLPFFLYRSSSSAAAEQSNWLTVG
jgi:hypothetical protein